MEAPRRALGPALGPKRFDRSPNVVHELGAATDQRLPRADRGHMSLALFAPVLERVQELRIEACQAGQVLKASISSVLRLLA